MPPQKKPDVSGYQAFKKDLAAGTPRKLYVLHGEETYLRDHYLGKLKELAVEINKRQEIAAYYEKLLRDYVVTPYVADDSISSYAQYVVRAKDMVQRDRIRSNMQERDIPSLLYYPCPMHSMPVFQGIETYGMNYDNTICYSETSFGIPFSPYITKKEQEQVAKAVIDAV